MMLVAYRGCELQRRLAPDVSSARGGTHFRSGAFHVMRSTLARTQVKQSEALHLLGNACIELDSYPIFVSSCRGCAFEQ